VWTSAFAPPTGVLINTNNSFNAAVYLGDANFATGGLSVNARNTNYVADGDSGFVNSGVMTIGGQNTSGTNTYANPIILGLTANVGKSVTLVATAGGEVDFTGGILQNGTDVTAGVTAGDATHAGIVNLTAANTYGGTTTVTNGTLLVNGSLGAGSVDIQHGTLGGAGTIAGWVTNEAGGILAPGAGKSAAGTVLTINNNVTLLAGSTNIMRVTHVGGNISDQIVSSGTVAYGGVLTVVTNAGDATPYAVGDTFTVFNASGGYSGGFSNIQPAPGVGLGWSNIVNTGSIMVISNATALPPAPVASFTVASTNIFVTQTVVFTNTTTGSVTNSAWSFGNGSTNTSGVNNVSDTYNTTGTYQVILTASGTGGSSAATNNIVVYPKPAINKPVLSNGSLIFSVSNAVPGATFAILTYTNLATNVVSWTVATNGVFDVNGAFNYTNTPLTNAASFFRLKSPYP
jgi:PKD repeat protein